MITDVRFLQRYNDIILENFNAVLKQNLLFQTQISVLEEETKKAADVEPLKKEIQKLVGENDRLKNDIEVKSREIKVNQNNDADKHRLQLAVNSQAQTISTLNATIEKLESTLLENSNYIKELEDALPNSKKKKFGIAIPEEVKQPIEALKIESSGGTF